MNEYRNDLASQAESINVERLLKAMIIAGCATPESNEEATARVGDLVNTLTRAVVNMTERGEA